MPYLPDVSQHPIYEPNGTIKIYHDVPLDSSYTHTFNSSIGDLATAISGYSKYTLTAQSYSRLTEGSVRVQLFKGDLISCNYMEITNGINGENFPYWCFITDVEYVNNTTSDIFFEIDYLQTFWHRFTIPANFIEREHCLVSEDVIGNNLINEGLETGELMNRSIGLYPLTARYSSQTYDEDYIIVIYIPNINDSLIDFSEPYITISGTSISTVSSVGSGYYTPNRRNKIGNNVPCFLAIPTVSPHPDLNDVIKEILKANGQIIGIYLVGNEFYQDNFTTESINTHPLTTTQHASFVKTNQTSYYTPKNAKLYTSEFYKFVINNGNGESSEYRLEDFRTTTNNLKTATFNIVHALIPYPVTIIYPTNYNGEQAEDYQNSVIFESYPEIPFSEDSYTKWWAQNKTNLGVSLATTAISTGFMVSGGAGMTQVSQGLSEDFGLSALQGMVNARLAGDPKSAGRFKSLATQAFEQEGAGNSKNMGMGRMGRMALGYGAQSIAKTLGQISIAKNTPDSYNIQRNTSLLYLIRSELGFHYYERTIRGEMAEIIDKYFDMFGYATHKVKVPNFTTSQTARPAYDYIKMQNCFILAQTGDRGLPEVAQNAIQAIFNNGITIWRTLSQIGNYNVTNR